jgi:hypothetical protein
MSLRAAKVQRRALLRREYRQIQPKATSVAVRVRIYWPEVPVRSGEPCRFG